MNAANSSAASPRYRPYRDSALSRMYNLLFADDPTLMELPAWAAKIFEWFGRSSDKLERLRREANNPAQDSRDRVLAYCKLRHEGVRVAPPVFLGVVFEMGIGVSHDALGAYDDGSIRYFNHGEQLLVFERGMVQLGPFVRAVMKEAPAAARAFGLAAERRRPPPGPGMVRLTVLSSDGPYVCQGPMAQIEHDRDAAPLFAAASNLLNAVVAFAAQHQKK